MALAWPVLRFCSGLAAATASYTQVHAGGECQSNDANLGDQPSVDACAAACEAAAGCRFFIYGFGAVKQGRCYFERTLSAECTEGWEEDEYDFYQLEGTEGCTDARASNYDSKVRFDDGSCLGQSGCYCEDGPSKAQCLATGPCHDCDTCDGAGTNDGFRAAGGLDELQAPLLGAGDIVLDGDLRDWERRGVPFHTDTPFANLDGKLVVFESYGEGGTYFGPSDFSVSFAVAWNGSALLLAADVRDDVLTAAPTCFANGLQLAFEVGGATSADAGMLQALRSADTGVSSLTLINLGLVPSGGAGAVQYPAACAAGVAAATGQGAEVGACCIHYERSGGGAFSERSAAVVVRNEAARRTTYEAAIHLSDLVGTSASHHEGWREGLTFGFSLLVNDGDERAAQQGWAGYYPHALVLGWNGGAKEAQKAGTVKLAAAEASAQTGSGSPPSGGDCADGAGGAGGGGGSGGGGGAGTFFGGAATATALIFGAAVGRAGYTRGWFARWGFGPRIANRGGDSGAPLAASDHYAPGLVVPNSMSARAPALPVAPPS